MIFEWLKKISLVFYETLKEFHPIISLMNTLLLIIIIIDLTVIKGVILSLIGLVLSIIGLLSIFGFLSRDDRK